MTPSMTACPPTSVSSPLSSTGINCMSAESRKKRLGDTIDAPYLLYESMLQGSILPVKPGWGWDRRFACPDAAGESPAPPARSSQKLLHHVALHVRQAELAAHVAVGQARVVHPQAVQNGGLQV